MIKLTYDQLLSLCDDECPPEYEKIENDLSYVDDHGDSTYNLVFRDTTTNEYWMVSYNVQKEWGIMKEDSYDCERVYPHIIQKTVWRSKP